MAHTPAHLHATIHLLHLVSAFCVARNLRLSADYGKVSLWHHLSLVAYFDDTQIILE